MGTDADIFIESLFCSEYNKLLLYAIAVTKCRNRSEDIVQETFQCAWQSREKLIQHPNPKGWLMLTLKNKIRDNERSHNRYLIHFLSLETDYYCQVDYDQSQDLSARIDISQMLSVIKSALNPQDYYLFHRIILEGEKHSVVARELGISIATSQKRLERVRKKVKPLIYKLLD